MRKLLIPAITACLIAAPAQARDSAIDLGPGAFVGAQFKLALGDKAAARPRAGLAIAPTRSSLSSDGMVRTRIGEGFMLDFTSAKRPTLTFAGARADTALGLKPGTRVGADTKMGLSSTGWIWIGAGLTAAVVAGVILHDSYCDSHIASHCGDVE